MAYLQDVINLSDGNYDSFKKDNPTHGSGVNILTAWYWSVNDAARNMMIEVAKSSTQKAELQP